MTPIKLLQRAKAIAEKTLAQAIGKDPYRWIWHLEDKSPQLTKPLLSVASQVFDPQWAFMGWKVLEVADHRTRVHLPIFGRNKTRNGSMSWASLVGLGEFTWRLYWERHLDPAIVELNLVGVHLDTPPIQEAIEARFELAAQDREPLLTKILSQGESEFDLTVEYYTVRQRRLASVTYRVSAKTRLALPPNE